MASKATSPKNKKTKAIPIEEMNCWVRILGSSVVYGYKDSLKLGFLKWLSNGPATVYRQVGGGAHE